MTTKDIFIDLPNHILKRWPANIRQHYQPDDVKSMAESQAERAQRGQPPCIHPVVVTPGPGVALQPASAYLSPKHTSPTPAKCTQVQAAGAGRIELFLVAGHLRREGNAFLGKKAPLLNCIVRYYPDEASMLADMRTENGQRSEPSPLEWGAHFKAELDRGVPLHVLMKESKKTKHFVDNCLALLNLQPEVSGLFNAGDLPLGAVSDLNEIGNAKHQVRLARRMRGATQKQIGRAVTQYLDLHRTNRKDALAKTSGAKAQRSDKPSIDGLPAELPQAATAADLRTAAQRACCACSINTLNMPEPAWHLALAAAGKVCDGCDLKKIRTICATCPLAEMMTNLARAHGVTREVTPVVEAL